MLNLLRDDSMVSFPGLPCFLFYGLRCVDNNTRKQSKEQKMGYTGNEANMIASVLLI